MTESRPPFVEIPYTKDIEAKTRERMFKGAFTDEARLELARAVSHEATKVQMDKWYMSIKYYPDYVYICNTQGQVPCGCFDRELLRKRLADSESK